MDLSEAAEDKIRNIFREEIKAVDNDVNEIYFMISDMQKNIRHLKKDVNYLRHDTNFIGSHLRLKLRSAG